MLLVQLLFGDWKQNGIIFLHNLLLVCKLAKRGNILVNYNLIVFSDSKRGNPLKNDPLLKSKKLKQHLNLLRRQKRTHEYFSLDRVSFPIVLIYTYFKKADKIIMTFPIFILLNRSISWLIKQSFVYKTIHPIFQIINGPSAFFLFIVMFF